MTYIMKKLITRSLLGATLLGAITTTTGITNPQLTQAATLSAQQIAKRSDRFVLDVKMSLAVGDAAELRMGVRYYEVEHPEIDMESLIDEIGSIQERLIQLRKDKPALPLLRKEREGLLRDVEELSERLPEARYMDRLVDELMESIKDLG